MLFLYEYKSSDPYSDFTLDPEIKYEYNSNYDKSKSTIFCVLRPSFEKVEKSLKKAGKQSYLDDPILYLRNGYKDDFNVKMEFKQSFT